LEIRDIDGRGGKKRGGGRGAADLAGGER